MSYNTVVVSCWIAGTWQYVMSFSLITITGMSICLKKMSRLKCHPYHLSPAMQLSLQILISHLLTTLEFFWEIFRSAQHQLVACRSISILCLFPYRRKPVHFMISVMFFSNEQFLWPPATALRREWFCSALGPWVPCLSLTDLTQ